MNEADAFLEMLQGLKKSQINEKYNEAALILGLKTVKRFSDKTTAIKRTRKMMVDAGLAPASVLPPDCAAPKKRQKVFRYPPSSEIRMTRSGFLRNKAQALLLGGATFAEVARMIDEHDIARGVLPHNSEGRAYALIRDLHRYCGWGLKEETMESGEKRIFVWAGKDSVFVEAGTRAKPIKAKTYARKSSNSSSNYAHMGAH